MSLSIRKSHTKSRGGCETCKIRHVKCDESIPACTQCNRRKVHCYYQRRVRHAVDGRSSTPTIESTGNHPESSVSPSLSNQTFAVLDLELIHFYSTETYLSLGNLVGVPNELWRDQIPQLAFRNPILLHAIFCLAASHLKHHKGGNRFDDAIALHKYHAVSLLRVELSSLTEPSSPMNEAAYGTSVFLAVQSIATFKSHSVLFPTDLDWIPLLTGFRFLIHNMWAERTHSIFYPLITSYQDPVVPTPEQEQQLLQKFNLAPLLSQLPPSYSEHIVRIVVLLHPFFPDEHYSKPPLLPVSRDHRLDPLESRQTLRQLIAWAATLPDTFVARAREGDPGILILLGWMFSLFREIYASKPMWWIERIATESLREVPPEWRNHFATSEP